MRSLLFALSSIAVVVMGVSAFNLLMAVVMMYVTGSSRLGSTCGLTRWFGARWPLCGLETGFPAADAAVTRALATFEPVPVWVSTLATAGAILAILMALNNYISSGNEIRHRRS